ncbi:hypothetical protein LTR37_013969 [Vermiconidia calcicola]|uniref:Uncharacterized protein n=1 Tax=Vermiconidia calcicola TaxID=1690605 RepID=A0ACC3MW64_9PEZI|nr:hypothetical protein LTR37_013969 [Vermiconidia calcicola]
MAAQQIQFAETIRAMKLALKRRADDSDSDSTPISAPTTNRNHKLHPQSRNIHAHNLDTTGRLSYRKRIDHAGYTRPIIAKKPRLYDPDGSLASSDDEAAAPVEDDPFGSVRVEELLRPLTSASELPEHPGLRGAYTSPALTQMAGQAAEMLRRERRVLWKGKRLLARLRGEAEWAPCGGFEAGGHVDMLGLGREEAGEDEVVSEREEGEAMDGVIAVDMAMQQAAAEAEKTAAETDLSAAARADEAHNANFNGTRQEGSPPHAPPIQTHNTDQQPPLNPSAEEAPPSHPSSDKESKTNTPTLPSHAMTTRTRARARSPIASSRSSSPASPSEINPWYLTPTTSLPDRDLGLPAQEAEETRRILLLYIQKQENIVRQLLQLHTSLLKADRLRGEVWRACKAEGHLKEGEGGMMVTEMSDGEDWYDPADWGLTERELKVGKDGVWGLEKGKDEVEDFGGEDGEGRRVRGRRRGVGAQAGRIV